MRIKLLYILILFICGCYSRPNIKNTPKNNIKQQNKPISIIHPDFLIYHQSENQSLIFFHIHSSQLLYAKTNNNDYFTSNVRINWKVYKTLEMKVPIDTGSVYINDLRTEITQKHIYASFPVQLAGGSNYYIKLTVNDFNKNAQSVQIIFTSKTNKSSHHYFYARNASDSTVCFYNALSENKIYIYTALNPSSKIYIRCYKKIFSQAPPPFSESPMPQFKYEPDSLLEIFTDNNGYAEIILPPYSFFQLQTDTASRTGISLFNFKKGFPAVTSEQMLMEPIRYMSSSSEFEKIKSSADIKSAVDNFWITRCGSKERAREIIKTYYTRVEEANRKFTSFTEGWKTDRGMIWIIFGEPSVIDRKETYESWMYRDRTNNLTLRFNFVKVKNPFTENDYWLERNISYKPIWYEAIETWRQGRVYNYSK